MSENSIKLLFSGDFAPLVEKVKPEEDCFSDLQDILNQTDIHVTNLECPLTTENRSIYKSGPGIKAHPDNIQLLKQAQVDIACLSNNHIFDFGEKGILDTVGICQRMNIETIGIIHRPDKQDHWSIREIKNRKIGFVNYCEHEISVRNEGLLGAKGYDPIDAYYEISTLRNEVDVLIVIYHGGIEYYHLPNPEQKRTFKYLADLGADAVVGHHSHVYSGYEVYNGKPLIFSLGNFFFPFGNEPEEWYSAIICQIEITDIVQVNLIPILQCSGNIEVKIQEKQAYTKILDEIRSLSHIISEDSLLKKEWKDFVIKKGAGYTKNILHSTRVERLIYRHKGLYRILYKLTQTKQRTAEIINIIRCQSLRYLLIDSLKERK